MGVTSVVEFARMRLLNVVLGVALAFPLMGSVPAAQAQRVTIVRDDWGIAHVHGKTDADAVFGMAYAQAEDDFNRVETNYLTALGRTAEADGTSGIYQDLRNGSGSIPPTCRRGIAAVRFGFASS
jgi:acyl-homoserine-lactone acylase